MIINKLDIREQNEATVLKCIIENKNISRANISTLTKLNKASQAKQGFGLPNYQKSD